MARLADKVALITGAGMGMGREASLLFAEHGARLIVADLNRQAAHKTVALVRKSKAIAATAPSAVMPHAIRRIRSRRDGHSSVLMWTSIFQSICCRNFLHPSS